MSLITLQSLPTLTIDAAALAGAAISLRAAARQTTELGTQTVSAWNGLPASYDTPECTDAVYKMAVVGEACTDFEDGLGSAATILGRLADDLTEVAQHIDALRADVEELRAEVLNYRWDEAGLNAASEQSVLLYGYDTIDRQWGEGHFQRNALLIDLRDFIQGTLDQVIADAARDLRAIGEPVGLGPLMTRTAALASGMTWGERQEQFTTKLAISALNQLSLLNDPAAVRELLAQHPEWADLLRLHPPAPDAVSDWWAGIEDDAVRSALVMGMPALVGALGGLPASVRVSANRETAMQRLSKLQSELDRLEVRDYDENQPYAHEGALADYIQRRAELKTELKYLQRVADGEVQLYLYDRDRGQVIEMFGDVDKADVVLSFMPGTNTSMESFYDRKFGITPFTHWEVQNAERDVNVAGFVVMQGAFPNLDVLASGPQYNAYAEVLGRRYAGFSRELDVIAPSTPVMSVEHSFGSGVAGVAESNGAHFDARYTLAGIGMTEGWEKQLGTKYFAAQGPGDINRYLDEVQAGGLGYAVSPHAANGFEERPTNFGVPDLWPHVLFGPGGVVVGAGTGGLEQHNGIISADESVNGIVLNDVALKLRELAGAAK
ncbi:alpha/beta hydrolase [Microbacterium sp. M3]|uniref:Alpha/beta hydrolase n=1 Tax=Microbacterium arthrosphaerae TaxID=792652 RepID=A0ABU4H0Q8_9MICO|nr:MULTISPECIES: alpha/beta hydrolase [Microbacterium]MDW4572906.1 alpha/beta hydrolase [Microbacterium arthrosphaerae]MDW7606761.1 alpha/beta hydrolase [Microbacterium sp. M3]